jgi:RimJ/RimL family protein N-acetyltransferase
VQQNGMSDGRLPDDVLARRERLPAKPEPVVLTGRIVTLRPFAAADADGLFAACNGRPFALGDRSVDAYDAGELIWKYMKASAPADPAALCRHLERVAGEADTLLMTVHWRGAPVGVACFMANRPADLKIELGNIWYGPIAQGAGVSREATHLMCGHAFALGYRRVEWKCDANNARSRRSALSYGFTFEGIQEAHMIVKGRNRDTAWFRMLDGEWPAVQSGVHAAPLAAST